MLSTRFGIAAGVLASLFVLCAAPRAGAQAHTALETPIFRDDVAAGKLPPVNKRLPATPRVMRLEGPGLSLGKPGGTLNMLIGRSRDVRMLVVYGYARLVGYDRNLALVPDILEGIDVREGRVFTMKLRKGHRWSDGNPFTTEDFRYYWEDVANNAELSPAGPPRDLIVDGEPAKFELLDETTVRYSWSKPNPDFLPRIAGASPMFIYRPAHYLKRFHKKYSAKVAEAEKDGSAKRRWSAVHNKQDNMYQFDNPRLPTLQPWVNTTAAPADRFVAVRNPYFHRVDLQGHQLPYIDRVVMSVAEGKLIPAKAGAGDSDLQARDIQFNNYTFLKQGEKRNNYQTLLWRAGTGAHFALFPNLNANDPVWRKLMRDVRFRRALSLAIDRPLVNQVLYFGLAIESNNTVLRESPLFREHYQTLWAKYDRKAAARLLDEIGLKRGLDGIRHLPDGRQLEIIVETAGESSEQADVLELIRETWREVGISLFTKPSQREVFRNRIFSGETLMSVWSGMENGIATPDMSPDSLAPTSQQQLQWPKFGQYYETSGRSGDAPDIPEAVALGKLNQAWRDSTSGEEREKIWHRMLDINAAQQFVIGVVSGVPQPVVRRNTLMNVPEKAVYSWDPGAHLGIYRPDTFWFK
ncbi:MAG: ABC transporter substrate-binding protein [Betaproteobacteria bacterium]|nr:ABC transporter substrate-binding protein [Betaproteobacteria bacterium]